MKIYILLLFAINILFATDVTIYLECNKKPYSYCDNGKVKGVSVDVIKALFDRIDDYRVLIKPVETNQSIIEQIKNKDISILGNIEKDEIPLSGEYTDSFIEKRFAIYCNRKINLFFKDFKNFKIAISNQNYNLEGYDKTINDVLLNKNKLIISNIDKSMKNLINNKIDCYIDDDINIKTKLALLKLENKYSIKKLNKIKRINKIDKKKIKHLYKIKYYLGFFNSDQSIKDDLIKKMNLAISVMRNTQEVGTILDKYYDILVHPNRKVKISASIFNVGDLVSKKQKVNGVMSAIISAAFETSNIDVSYNLTDSSTAYLYTKWGKSCITFPWFTNLERENYVYLSDPISSSTVSIFYNVNIHYDGLKYDSIEDLRSYKVGVKEDASYKDILDDNSVYYIKYSNIDKAISDLLFGEIDLFLSHEQEFFYRVKELFPNKLDYFEIMKRNFLKDYYYVLFSKKCANSQDMVEKFNNGLKKIRHNGKLDNLLKKFGVSKKEYYGYK